MRIEVLSLFPDYFKGPLDESIIKRARQNGLLEIELVNIRDFSTDRHKKVDDRPYGGGPGMVMMAEPVVEAVRKKKRTGCKVIYLSPQGEKLSAQKCKELAECKHLILLAGHYEGIDERAIDAVVDEEISIGDVVLTNGCLAACVLIDAVCRFIPGVVGDEQGVKEDSFEQSIFDWPHYTRPEVFEGKKVPQVLLSGNHEKILQWREKKALEKTKKRRLDLFLDYVDQKKRASKEAKQLQCSSCTIEVKDLQKSVQYYKKLFGLRVEKTSTSSAMVHMKPMPLELVASENPQASTVIFHVDMPKKAFLQCAVRAKEQVISDWEKKRLIAVDPDGYIWEIKERRNGKTRNH